MRYDKPPSIPKLPPALAALVDQRLTGARCTGKAPLFDSYIDGETPTARTERLKWAAHQCQQCPVEKSCSLAAHELNDAARTGVWAGKDRTPTQGRPPCGITQNGTANHHL